MVIGKDDPIALPKAPPPRPAARQAAIDAALRKFDGEETAPVRGARERAGWLGWASTHRGPASALATAAVVAVIGIPIALATLRDLPRPAAEQPSAPIVAQPAQDTVSAQDNLTAHEPVQNQTAEAIATNQASSEEKLAETREAQSPAAPMAFAPVAQKVGNAEPAPAMASAPPPPAPPPPPPAPAAAPEREGVAEAVAQDMVVTGSRVRSPSMSGRANRQAASPVVTMDSYGDFLSRLQSALKSDNRRAVSRMVGFPLTVNLDNGARTYRSRREVESDFDQIFTPAVKSEILDLKPYALQTGGDGKTRGSTRLWFSPTCFNEECSPPGPIRIREITP